MPARPPVQDTTANTIDMERMTMDMPGMPGDMAPADPSGWRMPPMQGMDMSMMAFLGGETPTVEPFSEFEARKPIKLEANTSI